MIKRFKISAENIPTARQWCLDNLGEELVRWWIEESIIGMERYAVYPNKPPFMLSIDLTEEEEGYLTTFILKFV